MTLLDIVIQLGLGAIGLSVIVFLYVIILVPIMSWVGGRIYPEGSESGQFALGFLTLLVVSIAGVAGWFLGGWLLGILQGTI